MQMEGQASAIDMQRQLYETHVVQNKLKDLKRFQDQSLDLIRHCMETLETVVAHVQCNSATPTCPQATQRGDNQTQTQRGESLRPFNAVLAPIGDVQASTKWYSM